MAVLEGLKPERVFYYFEKWCQIPHGSGHTEEVRRFLTDFAREHGLTCRVDDSDNVLIEKAAAPGYETAVPVIIQGHTDMVAEKTVQSEHDFETVSYTHLDVYKRQPTWRSRCRRWRD